MSDVYPVDLPGDVAHALVDHKGFIGVDARCPCCGAGELFDHAGDCEMLWLLEEIEEQMAERLEEDDD